MIAFVVLVATLSNGQVTDVKPVDGELYSQQYVCEQHAHIYTSSHPELRNDYTKVVCAEVERPEIN